MDRCGWVRSLAGTALVAVSLCVLGGCQWHGAPEPAIPLTVPSPDMPRELQKVSLPDYVIEPPDILLIDLVKVVPKAPYRIASLDILFLDVAGAPEEFPIYGNYGVEPGGVLNLGAAYQTVRVGGMTLEEAKHAIQAHLSRILNNVQVQSVALVSASLPQQVSGEHLVGPDGTVSLGTYGQVYVAGLTRQQAKQAIEAHLSQRLENPEVSVDVFAYNSKVYYIITQGSATGDGVYRLPITGNETVLDAVAQVQGLQPYSSKKIWIARPAPAELGCEQMLAVDWNAITKGAATATNYQVFPGDRIYIAEDPMYKMDSAVAKMLSPFERIFAFIGLGTNTISQLRFFHVRGNQFFATPFVP